mgnify:CR=1 FL=1
MRILRSDPFCRRGQTIEVHLFGLVGALFGSLSLLILRLKSLAIGLDVPGFLAVIVRARVAGFASIP